MNGLTCPRCGGPAPCEGCARGPQQPQLTRRFSRGSVPNPRKRIPRPLLRLPPGHQRRAILWLTGEGLPLLPLSDALTLGRHRDCELILPHTSVSRRHAVIKTRGRVTVFEDLGSRNGSLINGERVKRQAILHADDLLLLGPYTLKVADAPPPSKDRGVSGSLDDMPLVEVIQGIEFHRKTCTLRVTSGGVEGELVVVEGSPLRASWKSLRNESAVLAMLALGKGSFTLSMSVAGERAGGFRSDLKAMLFESLRLEDEGGDAFDTARF